MHHLLLLAIKTAIQAGRAILTVYDTDFSVERKADNSPLTLADRESHRVLVEGLRGVGYPILSEEGRELAYAERRTWKTFWLLDPLDGTKEFVKRNGEFTVNIALMADGRPRMGVIYVPVTDVLYFGSREDGAYKLTAAAGAMEALSAAAEDDSRLIEALFAAAEHLPSPRLTPERFTVVGSRSHSTPDVEKIVAALEKKYGAVDLIAAGSSLKICMVAEGRAHLYPRTGPTMEWDTAAGQAIAEAAGAQVLVFDTGEPLRYNKENLRNPWFMVKSGLLAIDV